MFSKSKKESLSDTEQREQYEYARTRINQKKGVLQHFTVFLAGSVIIFIINPILGWGNEFLIQNWFAWVLLIWGFIFLLHLFNVFIKNRFMDKEWEDHQLEKLKIKQEKRIEKLEKKIEDETVILTDTIEESNPEAPENL